MELKEITAKSILVPSKLPDTDYVINPYTGCGFGCTYCYASFMGRYAGKEISDWGNYVFVKINAPELLRRDIQKIKNNGKGKTIFLSSVTDPYQGVEAKYKLTRACLEILVEYGFEGNVAILTKSPLVLRDLDILKQFKNVEVGCTITSTDDSISRYFEKFAPNVSDRLDTLHTLNKEGLHTYAFVGPLLPHFVTAPDALDKVFKAIADTGTKEIYVEHINLSSYILGRLREEMKDADRTIMDKFYSSRTKEYRDELSKLVDTLAQKHHLHIRLDTAIYHKEM